MKINRKTLFLGFLYIFSVSLLIFAILMPTRGANRDHIYFYDSLNSWQWYGELFQDKPVARFIFDVSLPIVFVAAVILVYISIFMILKKL